MVFVLICANHFNSILNIINTILLCLRNGEGGIARVANPFSSLVAIAPSGWLTQRSTFFVVNAVTQ